MRKPRILFTLMHRHYRRHNKRDELKTLALFHIFERQPKRSSFQRITQRKVRRWSIRRIHRREQKVDSIARNPTSLRLHRHSRKPKGLLAMHRSPESLT